MATEGGGVERASSSVEMPHGRRLLLNSQRLTASYLRQLNKALGLPTTGSLEELRQQLEGQLAECEDPNMQVVIQETPKLEVALWLVNSDGPFLQTMPIHRECREINEVEQHCHNLEDRNAQLTDELELTKRQF